MKNDRWMTFQSSAYINCENCNCEFDSFCEAYGCFEMYIVIITSTFVLILPRLFILPEMIDTSVGILL